MKWLRALYLVLIVLVYIPMVFLGSNVFFPEYTGQNSYPNFAECQVARPIAVDESAEETTAKQELFEECDAKREAFYEAKRDYEGNKYVFLALFNLAVLAIALFVSLGHSSITLGLFSGSILTTFIATMRYMDTNSKIGFSVLVVTFAAMLFFIAKKKDAFVDVAKGKKKR